jgi:hypothetical protein
MSSSVNTFGERSSQDRLLPTADRLVVIAAPSGCGKSTLINKLRSGQGHKLADALSLEDVESWQFVDSEFLPDMAGQHFPRLVVHYALPALPLKRGVIRHISDDQPTGMLSNANRVSLVTLYTTPQVLLERINLRKLSRKANRWPVLRTVSHVLASVESLRSKSPLLTKTYRWEQLEKLFSDTAEIKALYGYWLDFVSDFDVDSHWLVCTEGEPVPQDVRDWEILTRDWK